MKYVKINSFAFKKKECVQIKSFPLEGALTLVIKIFQLTPEGFKQQTKITDFSY